MELINEYKYEIKKSKFIGLYYKVANVEEVTEILETLKHKHKKARHMPYAYKIGSLAKKAMIKNHLIQQDHQSII